MLNLRDLQIPPPNKWQDFESLCRDLWSRVWGDAQTQRHGRTGQQQQGVDIFGRPGCGTAWAGVQCKLREQLNGRLGATEIMSEVEKARSFRPRLSEYIIATSASRDASAQEAARRISQKNLDVGSFSVAVFGWEDIHELLSEHEDIVAKHYPHLNLAATSRLHNDYLAWVWEQLSSLQLLGVGSTSGQREGIPLADIYTQLEVTAEIRVPRRDAYSFGRGLRPDAYIGLRGDPVYLERLWSRVANEVGSASQHGAETLGRRLTALEAAAAVARLVILGPAGSGKSTFARYLALSLAGEALGRTGANVNRLNRVPERGVSAARGLTWPHGAILPVFVELRKLVKSADFPEEGEDGVADHLLKYIEVSGPSQLEIGVMLRYAFSQRGGALLILDGLDEVPSAEAERYQLQQVITSFCRRFPNCRVLLTCRPYAYEAGSPWRLDSSGFEETHLASFDRARIQTFISGWYEHQRRRQTVDETQAQRWASALQREVETWHYLQQLAERPLLLTMMAELHTARGGRLPGGRANLYEESVTLLLDSWNEIRDVLDSKSLYEHLGMSPMQLRQALEELAFEVHRGRGLASDIEAGEITAFELWQVLDDIRPRPLENRVDERRVMDYLHQRSGILVSEGPSQYRFPHRSLQEYLAACHLVRTRFPKLLLDEVKSDPTLWREVLLMAVGKIAEAPFMAWALLEGLVLRDPPDTGVTSARDCLLALYAGLAVEECELWREVDEENAGKLERIRLWLEASLNVAAVSPANKAHGGRVLGLLGDYRNGVSQSIGGVPQISWAEVPEGPFLFGSSAQDKQAHPEEKPQIEIHLCSFEIGRFPITNAQFNVFVEDGGYSTRQRECWTEAGWNWKGERTGPENTIPSEYLINNHPRVNVSFFEACAFCHWLGAKLGHEIRLPTEAEWEKAARGVDGRIFPWGDEFSVEQCNASETGIHQTTAVGAFPGGSSPYRIMDMSGNVWEWTLSPWTGSGYAKLQSSSVTPCDLGTIVSGTTVVVRGGSYWDEAPFVRSSFRYWVDPQWPSLNRGFRIMAPKQR